MVIFKYLPSEFVQFQLNNQGMLYIYNMIMKGNNNHTCQTFCIQYLQYKTFAELLPQVLNSKDQQSLAKKYEKELSKFIFIFKITYQNYKWNLKKRFNELFNLYKILNKRYGKDIPDFPLQKESQINKNNIGQVASFLVVFLKKTINTSFYDEQVQQFFDILPQKIGYGVIYGQFPLKKLSGGRYNEISCIKSLSHFIFPCVRTWRTRFFTITDNGVFYTEQKKTFQIKDMFVFCSRFQILIGQQQTGDQLGIIIISQIRQLHLKANNIIDFILFGISIKESMRQNVNVKNQRYDSFAPIRQFCQTKFYADGQQYFKDIQIEMRKAKKYIYITDWMITPYFTLTRQTSKKQNQNGLRHRFDHVLQDIAKNGVKIYIILYQEPKMAINNDSQHVERYLQKIHSNIKVFRHPNYLVIPFLWSHHEKSLLIDQKVAFVGGLDICYGRWDNHEHSLTNDKKKWYGADFCNLRITDIYFPRNFMMCSIDSRNQPRMPWHDVAIQIRGNSVHDLARHFITYWNFVKTQSKFDDKQLLNISGRKSGYFETNNEDIKIQQQPKHLYPLNSSKEKQIPLQNKSSIIQRRSNIQKNLSMKSKSVRKKRSKSTINKSSSTSRKEGQIQEAVDKIMEQQYYQLYLDERFVKLGSLELPRMRIIKQNILRMPQKFLGYMKDDLPEKELLLITNEEEKQKQGTFRHQFLRSASRWSLGLMQKENSIHNAYLDMISTSEHFIYIENQFFICKENLIVEKLAQRIIRAHESKLPFKVVIFIPLLPGFQGDVRQQKSAVMRIQLYWEYWTICRSKKSLYQRLKHIQNIDNYLYFFSLRQHGISEQGIALTEILYIHSKLMIIDDKKLIIGSANINDRSLSGGRDSQLAIIVQDSQSVKTKYGYQVSAKIQKYRIKLFMEHFGIDEKQGQDFLNEQFWTMAKIRANNNTLIYRQLFGCYPDDTMLRYDDITKLQKKSRPDKYKNLSNDIKGHIVELPLKFLEKQDLDLSAKERQYYLPRSFFT